MPVPLVVFGCKLHRRSLGHRAVSFRSPAPEVPDVFKWRSEQLFFRSDNRIRFTLRQPQGASMAECPDASTVSALMRYRKRRCSPVFHCSQSRRMRWRSWQESKRMRRRRWCFCAFVPLVTLVFLFGWVGGFMFAGENELIGVSNLLFFSKWDPGW